MLFAGLWILLLVSITDIVVAISMFAGWSTMVALVDLLFVVYIWARAKLLGKAFLGRPQGLGSLVGSLHFKFDWMGYLTNSFTSCFDSSMYKLMAISNCLVFSV